MDQARGADVNGDRASGGNALKHSYCTPFDPLANRVSDAQLLHCTPFGRDIRLDQLFASNADCCADALHG